MDKKECIEKLKQLNDMMEDYLDMMEIEEADERAEEKAKKKEAK
jgi:hypothetical protein